MGNKKKKQPKQQKQNQPIQKSEVRTVVSVDDVLESKTEPEFIKNRDTLINQLTADIERLNNEKTAAEKAVQSAEEKRKEIEAKSNDLKVEKDQLQKELDGIKAEYEDALETIDKAEQDAQEILDEANNDATSIREAAEKERLETLTKASDEARAKWKEQIDNLAEQIDDIARREKELFDAQQKLSKEKLAFELDKEALDDEKAYINQKKERYDSTSPAKVEELTIDLNDEKQKFAMLQEKYSELSKRFNERETLLESVKTEIEDASGGKKISSIREIVSELQEIKEKYDALSAVCSKYPDKKSIAVLEEKASKTTKLEQEKKAIEQDRDRYREEASAAKSVSRELEVIRQEVDATNALNEHLLQELQSHKTALESRTGDTCPSLSKVDAETEEEDFKSDITQRIQRSPISTLKELVSHVKNYAGSRNKKEQLFYKDNDIRAFLAGMAVSRLIILQGMSGTGKSSLPRIFSEAISGFNKLIPVESSWRDRNELLGYYNDFNKKFNAKSFTIELYRSSKKRCREIPTFIVLDEMNLARIEYYFSDFLAILQEPDHDKWLIELVSSDMRTLPMAIPDDVKQNMKREDYTVFEIWEKIERSRQGDLKSETSDEEKEILTEYLAKLGQLTGAKDLIDGRKMQVTDNIWFVGTANRDESTFEISDKVYDRAQVVSLNEKGKSEGNYINTSKKFISVEGLQRLFDIAIRNNKKKAEVEARLDELDKVLMDKFDVSFGNRIVSQTIDFVAVFMAAGGTLEDALDYQISTKIVRKVLSNDETENFIALLNATKDYEKTQALIKKQIKDLK